MRVYVFALMLAAQLVFGSRLMFAQDHSLKDYYFPYSRFTQGVVYKYAVKDDPHEVIYWHMVAVPQESDTLLLTSIYDVDYTLVQRTTESIQDDGATLVRYVIYRFNPQTFRTDSVVAAISDNHIYQWDPETYPFEYGITHRQIYNRKNETTFQKKRKRLTGIHRVNYKGSTVPSIKFSDEYTEILRVFGQKNGTVTTFSQESFYGLGLGLIEYSRGNAAGNKYNYRLVDVVSAESWLAGIRKTRTATPHKI